MLRADDIKLCFRSEIDIKYKEELDRLFFFNGHQKKWEEIVEQSIDDYACPVLKEKKGRVAIEFNKAGIGQTLHILDSDKPGASLIGVVMYARDSKETVTLVHLVLHEQCHNILKENGVNVGMVVLQHLIRQLKKLKGVKKLRFYYTGKTIPVI